MAQQARAGSDDETTWLIAAVLVAIGGGYLSLSGLWHAALVWMAEHALLITGPSVQLSVPGGRGIGLDWARILILLAVAVGAAAVGATALVNRRRRARAAEGLTRTAEDLA